MSNKIRAYVSHSIRGKFGNTATDKQIEANNQKATEFGKKLAKEFPNIDFHIPEEYDEFTLIAYRWGLLTETQILDIDCEIISRCNFLIVYSPDDYISRGMQIEVDYALANKIHIVAAIDGSSEQYFKRIVYGINCYLTSCIT